MHFHFLLVYCVWGGILKSAIGNDSSQNKSSVPPPVAGHRDVLENEEEQKTSSTLGTTELSVDPFSSVSVTSVTTPIPPILTTKRISSNSTMRHTKCPPAKLDECLAKMPPIYDMGIPASAGAVQTACQAFDVGMACVESWAKVCLGKGGREKVRQSVRGAHETFAFLCYDKSFRTEYLKHGDCYRKISYLWDECSRHFIENLKKFDTRENSTTLCCVRISYLKCVTEVAHLHCSRDAAMFLQRMAETLVRATMRSHAPQHCVNISHRNCTMVNGSPSTSLWEWPHNLSINSNSIVNMNSVHFALATQLVLLHYLRSFYFI